jgi:uncharacterized protein YndB with AHSA1/START domain
MAEIHKTVTIDAPAERVFDLLDDPAAIPSYTPKSSASRTCVRPSSGSATRSA